MPIISSGLKNIGNLMAKGGGKLGQAAKTAEKKWEPRIAAKGEEFANKIKKNFTKDKLKTMAKKLEKYSDASIKKMKEVATSLLNELARLLGVAFEEVSKVVNYKNIRDFMTKAEGTLKKAVADMVKKMGPPIASTAEKFAHGVRKHTEKYC